MKRIQRIKPRLLCVNLGGQSAYVHKWFSIYEYWHTTSSGSAELIRNVDVVNPVVIIYFIQNYPYDLDLIRKLRDHAPNLPIAVLTENSSIPYFDFSVECCGFLCIENYRFGSDELRVQIGRAVRQAYEITLR